MIYSMVQKMDTQTQKAKYFKALNKTNPKQNYNPEVKMMQRMKQRERNHAKFLQDQIVMKQNRKEKQRKHDLEASKFNNYIEISSQNRHNPTEKGKISGSYFISSPQALTKAKSANTEEVTQYKNFLKQQMHEKKRRKELENSFQTSYQASQAERFLEAKSIKQERLKQEKIRKEIQDEEVKDERSYDIISGIEISDDDYNEENTQYTTLEDIGVSSQSLSLLDPPETIGAEEHWLNDEIINGYIELIRKRNVKDIEIFNTWAYPKLKQLHQEDKIEKFDRTLSRRGVKRISDLSKLFIPVNIERSHWLLIVVNIAYMKFEIYDSIQGFGRADEILTPIKEMINYRLKKEENNKILNCDSDYWDVASMDCPQQKNGSDCGVCVLLNINLLSIGRMLNYKLTTPKSKTRERSLLINLHSAKEDESRKKREHIKNALLRGYLDDENDNDLGMILYSSSQEDTIEI